jgi:hypothetical protein
MACLKHNVAMLRLVLRGDIRGPKHAQLLADVRRCRWCKQPAAPTHRRQRASSPVPQPRSELRVLHDSRR